MFYWTQQGCKNGSSCNYSHNHFDKSGVDLVGIKEWKMATKYVKDNPPKPPGGRAQSPSKPKPYPQAVEHDVKGMCFYENFGNVKCTFANCTFKHRRDDYVSKNPKACQVSKEELKSLPKGPPA